LVRHAIDHAVLRSSAVMPRPAGHEAGERCLPVVIERWPIADPDLPRVVFAVAVAAYAEPHQSSFSFDDLRQTVHQLPGGFMRSPQFVFANQLATRGGRA
jgi:hypothetical protein